MSCRAASALLDRTARARGDFAGRVSRHEPRTPQGPHDDLQSVLIAIALVIGGAWTILLFLTQRPDLICERERFALGARAKDQFHAFVRVPQPGHTTSRSGRHSAKPTSRTTGRLPTMPRNGGAPPRSTSGKAARNSAETTSGQSTPTKGRMAAEAGGASPAAIFAHRRPKIRRQDVRPYRAGCDTEEEPAGAGRLLPWSSPQVSPAAPTSPPTRSLTSPSSSWAAARC